MRVIQTVILLFSITLAQAQGNNPYAVFGYNSSVDYKTRIEHLLYIKNNDTSSDVKALAYDFVHHTQFALGKQNRILKHRLINPQEILRFLSIDPLYGKYPHNSTYAFSENRVTDGVELEGLEVQNTTKNDPPKKENPYMIKNYSLGNTDAQQNPIEENIQKQNRVEKIKEISRQKALIQNQPVLRADKRVKSQRIEDEKRSQAMLYQKKLNELQQQRKALDPVAFQIGQQLYETSPYWGSFFTGGLLSTAGLSARGVYLAESSYNLISNTYSQLGEIKASGGSFEDDFNFMEAGYSFVRLPIDNHIKKAFVDGYVTSQINITINNGVTFESPVKAVYSGAQEAVISRLFEGPYTNTKK